MDFFEHICEGLKRIVPRFFSFFKKLFMTGFIYSVFNLIPIIIITVCVILAKLFYGFGLDKETLLLIAKILYTAGQIIPVSWFLGAVKDDDEEEVSIDLCFAICIMVISYIWII